MDYVIAALIISFVVLAFVVWLLSRYQRCSSDKILVVFGKVGGSATGKGGMAAKCYHGGAAFILPVFQDYAYLDLAPMPIDIKLEGALSQQNIRVNTPSTFTVGISTEPGVMENAAERLLGMDHRAIQELAKDIIFGQMRVVIATMPIEEINADRDKLVLNISNGVEIELKKVGLRLINVNVQDITDESGYIEALGKEAAARAINEAKIKVSQKERDGDIGKAEADREKRIRVAAAHAAAVDGENEAAVKIANSNASRREREAEAQRLGTAAEKVKAADALREAYAAEELAERQRAKKEEAAQTATTIVHAEIEKRKIEVMAEAEKRKVELLAEADKRRVELNAEAEKRRIELIAGADGEKIRLVQRGEADGVRAVLEAQAEGTKALLTRKAEGFRELVAAAGGTDKASMLMITEQLPQLIAEQVKAISSLKIDKVTVWDGGRNADGRTATADYLSGLVGALPPLHELTKSVGIKLPGYLGEIDAAKPGGAPARGEAGPDQGQPPPPAGPRKGP
jgi:flotillin